MKSRKEKWFSNIYISIDEKITYILVKTSVQDENFCNLGLVEMASLLKKEEITPRLGGSTVVLLIYVQSFFSSKKWSKMSSSFLVRKVV
jgi:hypothetical protein